MTSIAPLLEEEPKATTKHTLCGYAWGDVTAALLRAIGTADMSRAQRWAAELVCSDLGLGRLEATLLHAWALHVGGGHLAWPRLWYTTIQQIRSFWSKSGGDIKAVRNTPLVRQLVAEATAALVLAAKKPLPTLPTSADCFREAEAMRSRLLTSGGVGDQVCVRRVFVPGVDGTDLRTIGNEFESALRANQVTRLLFWLIWMITLETQADAPPAKDRGPAHLSVKARKSLLWFLINLLKELANEGAFLAVEERNGLFGCLEVTWAKLGAKGRRDVLAAATIAIQEHLQRRGTLTITGTAAPPSLHAVRAATTETDKIYTGIATEARRFMLERPVIVGLTKEAVDASRKPVAMGSIDKLALVFDLAKR